VSPAPRLLACAAAALLAWGSSTAQTQDSGPVPLQRLSLGEIGGWIQVPVMADGQPGRWLLDTGSSRHIVTRAWAERQGLTAGRTVRATTAVGSLQGREVALPSLHLGAHDHAGQTAVQVDDLRAVLGAAGEGLDGILGLPLLQGVTLDLDLQRWTLSIAKASPPACPPDTAPLTLGMHQGLPVIGLRINGGPLLALLLDTGNPAAVVRLAAADPAEPGLVLPGNVQLALADQVSVDRWTRRQVPVLRLNAPALQQSLAPDVQGLAGTALLDGARWQIDLAQRRACVSTVAPALPGGFGLTLVQRDGATWIGDVLEGGPAQQAGLRPGERVQSWAGEAATGPLRELWARTQDRPQLKLQVGEGAAARQVDLTRAYFLPRLP
jgi:hypothetical protein